MKTSETPKAMHRYALLLLQIKLYLLYRYKPANLMHDDKPNHRMPRGDGRGTNVKDGRVLCLRLEFLL